MGGDTPILPQHIEMIQKKGAKNGERFTDESRNNYKFLLR